MTSTFPSSLISQWVYVPIFIIPRRFFLAEIDSLIPLREFIFPAVLPAAAGDECDMRVALLSISVLLSAFSCAFIKRIRRILYTKKSVVKPRDRKCQSAVDIRLILVIDAILAQQHIDVIEIPDRRIVLEARLKDEILGKRI